MKKYYLYVIACACLFPSLLNAQSENDSTSVEKKFLFLDNLVSAKAGEGVVTVNQDSRLPGLMSLRSVTNKKKGDKDFILANGYRVQIYSSNAPRVSKDEAFALEAEMNEKFPDVGAYISFSSPFWRVRAGDCKSQQEANELLEILKKEFPDIKDQFYVVKEEVKIPIE
jgi:hypothetical protein